MKFFVTGVNGQLGHDVMNELKKRGHEGVGSDIAGAYAGVADGSAVTTMPYVGLDITDKEAVLKVISEIKPDAVIHCAAWTAVDMAEDDDKVEKVRAVNAGGTQNIADACKAIGCKMLYLSTDYVFDGQGTEPWQPDCKDYKPLNVYGQTKLEGELAVANTLEKYFIVRIAWVFGLNGKNFIKTMINVGKTHDEVRVVNDQIGTPTYRAQLTTVNEMMKAFCLPSNSMKVVEKMTCEILKLNAADQLIKVIIGCVGIIAVAIALEQMNAGMIAYTISVIILSVIVYFGIEIILKNESVYGLIKGSLKRIKKR